MRVLPVAFLAECAQVVQHTILIKVVLEEKLARWGLIAVHHRHDGLRRAGGLRGAAHSVCKWHASHWVHIIATKGVLIEQLHAKLCLLRYSATVLSTKHIGSWLEAKLTLVNLIETLVGMASIQVLLLLRTLIATSWTSHTLVSSQTTHLAHCSILILLLRGQGIHLIVGASCCRVETHTGVSHIVEDVSADVLVLSVLRWHCHRVATNVFISSTLGLIWSQRHLLLAESHFINNTDVNSSVRGLSRIRVTWLRVQLAVFRADRIWSTELDSKALDDEALGEDEVRIRAQLKQSLLGKVLPADALH